MRSRLGRRAENYTDLPFPDGVLKVTSKRGTSDEATRCGYAKLSDYAYQRATTVAIMNG